LNDKKIDADHKELVKAAKSDPALKKDHAQIHAVSGIGITGLLGSIGLEAMSFLGENVAEIIGGGTGAGVVIFFLTKFFITEMGEHNNI
jgi:hypothetical protein